MANETIKAGDKVRLKSGGPLMVVSYTEGDEAGCEWFNEKHEPQGRRFRLIILEKADRSPTVA